MSDTIKTYCHFCRGPIFESDLRAGFAVVRQIKKLDHAPFDVTVHLYHSREAQDVLRDKEYMSAGGEFLKKLDLMGKQGTINEDSAKELAVSIAKDRNLDFDKLDLTIKAFYSYSISESRKGRSDGVVEKG